MRTLWNDLRFAARLLLKAPSFTIAAVVTLGLAAALNTSIFSIVDAVILRPLPVPQPRQLISVFAVSRSGAEQTTFSFRDYSAMRDRNSVFTGLGACTVTPAIVGFGQVRKFEVGEVVSSNYFETLGVSAHIGRVFSTSGAAEPVAVISHASWERNFGRSRDVLGQQITINGKPATIAGVAPPGFRGILRGLAPEFWISMETERALSSNAHLQLDDRKNAAFWVFGRLKAGTTPQQASSNLGAIMREVAAPYGDESNNRSIILAPADQSLLSGGDDRMVLGASAVVVALALVVLLIACGNLTNLMLSRAVARRNEIGIRVSLGASRSRLIRQLLTESLLLSVVGSAVGLVLSLWVIQTLNAIELPLPIPVALDLRVSVRVMLFTLGTAALAALAFGLTPALQASHVDPIRALNADAAVNRVRSGSWTRRGLIVSQITLSLVLLVYSGLAIRSFRNARAIEIGFKPEGLAVGSIHAALRGYSEDQGLQLYARLVERVRSLPGVASATLASTTPLTLNQQAVRISRPAGSESTAPDQLPLVDASAVWPDYFKTMGVPILSGREFLDSDTISSPHVAVINQTMARRLWPGGDPVGRRLMVHLTTAFDVDVVGVAGDGKYRSLGEEPLPFIFLNLKQSYQPVVTCIARAGGSEASVAPLLASMDQVMRRIDPELPFFSLQSMKERISVVILIPRYAAALFGIMGALGTVIALVGVYAVTSYSVEQRTGEIGIRMALGCRPTDLVRLFLADGLRLGLLGISLGLVIAGVSARILRSLLYGISPSDPLTFAVTAFLVGLSAAIACLMPALRASRLSPAALLRRE